MGDELTPIWGPKGDEILSMIRREFDLPEGRIVRESPDWDADAEQPTMLALRVDPDVAEQYGIAAGPGVNPLDQDDRHITIAYFGELPPEGRQRLHESTRRWMADSAWPQMEGRAQGYGTFVPSESSDNGHVLWTSWDIPGLTEMRNDVLDTVVANGLVPAMNHGFAPHETLAYCQNPVTALPDFPDPAPQQTFKTIVVGEGGKWTEYPLWSPADAIVAGGQKAAFATFMGATGLEDSPEWELNTLIAGGGADRNRGNAENLRRYWTVGRGGAKIRWNTKGDWERCVKHLSKYMGPRAAGYCQLRHKEMTGMHTGDMKHRIMYGWGGKPGSYWAAKAAKASLIDGLTASGEVLVDPTEAETNPLMMLLATPAQKVPFRIPLLLPEGVESGDGRTFTKGATEWRTLPLPLLWQPNSMQGHDGAAIVGRIDKVERTDDGVGNAIGVFDSSPLAQEAVRMIRDGFLRGVSADLDRFEAKIKGKGPGTSTAKEKSKDKKKDDGETISTDKMDITQGRIMAATLVAKPAFEQCRIELMEDSMLPDGEYRQKVTPEEVIQAALMAASIQKQAQALTAAALPAAPVYPPSAWFGDPGLKKPTHLTITDDGRVFGHIAAWHVDHIGMGFGTRPPRSRTNYAYFRTGLLRTQEGEDIRVGQLTLAGGHASLSADARGAVKHYDDTASAFADVAAGEDQFGIWVAGALRPTVTPEQLRAARASSPSGDWRPIGGRLELVAVCQVNVPGFPVVEARVASGQVLALVAAGVTPLWEDRLHTLSDVDEASMEMQSVEPTSEQSAEQFVLEAQAASLRYRMLAAKEISAERRKELAKKGWALSDGAYPIANLSDLKRAIQSYGRAKESERKMVRDHIMKRAKALGHADLIPDSWKNMSVGEEQAMTAAATLTETSVEPSTLAVDGVVRNARDLQRAVNIAHTLGGEAGKMARSHLLGRAKTLGRMDLIPSSWWEPERVERPFVRVRDPFGRFQKVYFRVKNLPGGMATARVLNASTVVHHQIAAGYVELAAAAELRKSLAALSASVEPNSETYADIASLVSEVNRVLP